MNKQEARSILAEQLAAYRRRSFAEQVALIGNDEHCEVTAPSGVCYQVEVQAVWTPGGTSCFTIVPVARHWGPLATTKRDRERRQKQRRTEGRGRERRRREAEGGKREAKGKRASG